MTRADFLPQVGVSAGYGYGGGLKLNGDDSNSGSFSAMASVAIPIFQLGERDGISSGGEGRGRNESLE